MRENSGVSTKPHSAGHRSTARTACYSKRKGEMAELIFVVKAASMGFAVSKPYGDSEPYDLVVEENGRLLRIQVKSVFTTKRWDTASPSPANASATTFDIPLRKSISSPPTSSLTMPGTSCPSPKLQVASTSAYIPKAQKSATADVSRNTAKPGTCSA
jgi:PD-(D/E)XK endonuclease